MSCVKVRGRVRELASRNNPLLVLEMSDSVAGLLGCKVLQHDYASISSSSSSFSSDPLSGLFVPCLSPPQLSVNKLFIKQTVGMLFFPHLPQQLSLPPHPPPFVFYPHSLLHLSAYLFISYLLFISDAASPSPRDPFGARTHTQACTLQISILNGFHIETRYSIHFQSLCCNSDSNTHTCAPPLNTQSYHHSH